MKEQTEPTWVRYSLYLVAAFAAVGGIMGTGLFLWAGYNFASIDWEAVAWIIGDVAFFAGVIWLYVKYQQHLDKRSK